jgi:nucleotide-binding universal stress UspA family protein
MARVLKMLIAIDGSESSMGAVRYISQFQDPKNTKFTLIHIMRDLPEAAEDLKNMPIFEAPPIEADVRCTKMKSGIEKKMIDAQEIFLNAGYEKNAIEIKIRKCANGVAKDIITESRKGYDAVVVGRRGISDSTDNIVGKTAYWIMSGINNLPVAVVGDKPSPKHVLIGFDGSENSFKAVDCACLLMPKDGRTAMLCYVGNRPAFSDDVEKVRMEQSLQQIKDLMHKAANRLVEAGFDPDLVVQEILERKISRAVEIARTAEIKGYGTIVIGKRGLSVIRNFLMGHVSLKVLHRAHEMSVWIV